MVPTTYKKGNLVGNTPYKPLKLCIKWVLVTIINFTIVIKALSSKCPRQITTIVRTKRVECLGILLVPLYTHNALKYSLSNYVVFAY